MKDSIKAILDSLIAAAEATRPDKDEFSFDGVPGMTIDFADAEDALGVSKMQQVLIEHACGGNIIKLDAITGATLRDYGDLKVSAGLAILDEGWYGRIHGCFTIGPFERKSQAMNGLALALAGLPVAPGLGVKLLTEQEPDKDDEYADLIDVSRIPEDLRTDVYAEAREQLVKTGMPIELMRSRGVKAVCVPAD